MIINYDLTNEQTNKCSLKSFNSSLKLNSKNFSSNCPKSFVKDNFHQITAMSRRKQENPKPTKRLINCKFPNS